MKLWSAERGQIAYLSRIMARLTRFPPRSAALAGMLAVAVIVLLDFMVRPLGVRLVPLYVPLLCLICWALGRWMAIIFAVATAVVAIVPDALFSPTPFGLVTASNALVRTIAYLILALIIVAYRRTFDEADLRSMYDGLTGVLNKMSFHAAAKRQIEAARRMRQTLLIAYVDLDDFKAVNTHHGHKTGDAALRAFALEAMDAIRGSDLVGRLGGDEFGFVLAAATEHGAEALGRLLHQRLTTRLSKTGLPLSCSMGALVVSSRTALAEAELLDAADRIMRRAKAGGKNIVLTEAVGALVPS